MIFSKPCQYAILAMTYLAEQEPGELIATRRISEGAGVPMPILGKIVSALSRHGLVSARRGPKGGVTLARPAEKTTVGDVMEAIDGPLRNGRCALGFAECNDTHPCPIHESWKQIREELSRTLEGRTLVDLARARRGGGDS